MEEVREGVVLQIELSQPGHTCFYYNINSLNSQSIVHFAV